MLFEVVLFNSFWSRRGRLRDCPARDLEGAALACPEALPSGEYTPFS